MTLISRLAATSIAGFAALALTLANVSEAQMVALPQQLQGGNSLSALGSGDPIPPPSLGNLNAPPHSGTWSTPGLPEQRPVFAAVDENTYLVGPGDHFHIGTGVRFFNVMVGPEGDLVVEGTPPIPVDRLTLREARAKILDALSGHYKRENLQVRLSHAKRFQILVAGAVNFPGLHPMESGSRVANALAVAGGFTFRAAREVTLVRANGTTESVDLRGFFLEGDLRQNPELHQGDRLIVPTLGADRAAVGVRDGAHVIAIPLQDGESYEDFILRYDGYRDARPWTHIRVFEADGRLRSVLSRAEAGAFSPEAGTVLEIQSAKPQVFIGGMVLRPGTFDYQSTMTAMDYLALAGITVNTSDVRRISVLGSDGKKRTVNPTRDALRPGDHILVPRSFEAAFRDHIMIISAISSLAVAIATFVVLTGG